MHPADQPKHALSPRTVRISAAVRNRLRGARGGPSKGARAATSLPLLRSLRWMTEEILDRSIISNGIAYRGRFRTDWALVQQTNTPNEGQRIAYYAASTNRHESC
jgi:hypothetical protein